MQVTVTGAVDEASAATVARSVAASSLTKVCKQDIMLLPLSY